MTTLEQQVLGDGFRIVLLQAEVHPAQGRLAFRAVLFDGGREQRACEWSGSYWTPAMDALTRLRALLVDVLAPPHLLIGCGHGWRQLLNEQFAALAGEFRTVDLAQTAAALVALPRTADLERIAQSYGLGPTQVAEHAFSPLAEDLLWAVCAAAGKRGLRAADLSGLVEQLRMEAQTFVQIGAGLDWHAYPEIPAVYVMRDRDRNVLYVGKAANLARRLQAYFQGTWCPDTKLQRLRDQLAAIEVRPVGSELEALLLENRLIRRLKPNLNVQRELTLAESAAPYTGHDAVVLVMPSAKAERVELFFLGRETTTVQVQAGPGRWPEPALAQLARRATGAAGKIPKSPLIRDLKPEGTELCRRYFDRFHLALRWVGMDAVTLEPDAFPEQLWQIVQQVLANPAPVEFRLGG